MRKMNKYITTETFKYKRSLEIISKKDNFKQNDNK